MLHSMGGSDATVEVWGNKSILSCKQISDQADGNYSSRELEGTKLQKVTETAGCDSSAKVGHL